MYTECDIKLVYKLLNTNKQKYKMNVQSFLTV